MLPKITIITSTFNAEKYLENCILSVRNQTFSNYELIIVDGGSNDNTLSIIDDNMDIISYHLSEPDTGIYDAWNKGVKASKGQWILFLGADDELLPDAIENYTNFLKNIKDKVEYISAKVIFTDVLGKQLKIIGKPWIWKVFRRYMNVAHVASLHSKSFFEKYGSFDQNFKIVGDYEIMLRAGESLTTAFMDLVVARMRDGGVSNNPKKVFSETLKAKRLNKSSTSLACLLDYYLAWTKYILNKIVK